MDNIAFVDEEDIPLVHQDDDYDDTTYETPNTSRIETSFTVPDTTEALRQKIKRDKINALYRHLNVTGNLDLIDIDRFTIKKNIKTGNTDLFFLDANDQ